MVVLPELALFIFNKKFTAGILVLVSNIYMVCLWTKKLYRTLVISSPFQTFELGLLFEFID